MARKISARELVAAIKSGIGYDALAERFELSDQDAAKVFSKLVSAGLIHVDELPKKTSPTLPDKDSQPDTRTVPSFKCPLCGTVAVEGDEVCVHCGMTFKGADNPDYAPLVPWMEDSEDAPEAAIYRGRAETSRGPFMLILYGAAAGLVLLCAIGIWWFKKDAEEERRLQAIRQERIETQRRLNAEAEAKRRELAKPADEAGRALQAREEERRRQVQAEERIKELERKVRFQGPHPE